MALVCQHRFSINQCLVIVLIVQSSSCWTTPTDGKVGLNAPNIVVLLSIEDKMALKLAFTHAWLAILQDRNMRFSCDLSSPAHGQDFVIILDGARLADYIVKYIVVDSHFIKISILRDHSLKL